MAFRAYLSRSVQLLTLRRCNKNTPTGNNSAVMVNSTTESFSLLSPGEVKQRRDTLGSRWVVKDVVSSKDSQERTLALAYPPEHYFDTHQVVMKLQALGYSLEQSEVVVSLMAESLHNSLKPMWASMITQKDMKLIEQHSMSDIKALQNDLELIKKGRLDVLHLETKTLDKECQNLHKIIKMEIRQIQSGIKVDLHREKSRIKVESIVLQQKIKDINSRLSSEIAQLKTQMAAQKLESSNTLPVE